MKRSVLILVSLFLALSLAAVAGTLEGTAPKNAVVYVNAVPGGKTAAPHTFAIDQKSMQFSPHVMVVPVGSTVAFENHDVEAHNVMWPSVSGDKKAGHNMGTFPPGKSVSYKFDKPGVYPLLCNIHAEMSAYVVVTPTPYYAKADPSGKYSIANLPDGKYEVTEWSEGKKPETKSVTVANGDAKLNF